ncbi:hypothetical protein SULI_05835 [Saccharolobus solfataricus]|uniref:Cobalt transport protein n=3 Tax=Saccharolobus solfataricus TaxID=2287 RepID=Q980V9_SACS2|nr:hypothetical protein [Saccharolobus solfataricus]AAK40513.1 Hypothetical protein SSO0168 [Saccharolobus solfataricus P2]AKA73494.1 hypothetical protein SULB_1183 [Saccharolobus solfataricus]AKA76192.1 hypothetical protein SULC_1181 [Saccharolobus solfataricus]AKA78884.1 hypothetical protein SULA_1182 [Saccharolobus solfataricus]AZF67961.1 hypothetical protein SULG_05835 [Saccharolobus solfataricus]
MKVKFLYILLFSVIMYINSIFFNFFVPFLVTLAILYRRIWIIVIEVLIGILSFLILSFLGKIFVYEYTLRAFSIINVFLISSEYTDKSSIIDLFGSKGVPLVIALTYYPRFYEMIQKVVFYARIRNINLLNLNRLLLPIIVETVKIADNLYVAYTVKLFGKYNYKRNLKPSSGDLILLLIGVVTLCLSLVLNI